MKKQEANPAGKIISSIALMVFIILFSSNCYSSIFSYNNSTEPQQDQQSAQPAEAPEASKQDDEVESTDNQLRLETPKVGKLFNDMLDSLISITTDSKTRFALLFTSVPLIFPDLYKVFTSL